MPRWYPHENPPTGWYWINTSNGHKERWVPCFMEDETGPFGREFYLDDRYADWKWVGAIVGPIPQPE